jgi:hypothetical protein
MLKNQSNPHKANQVHPPLPKKKRVDERGNDRRRLWLKDGKTTMPFVEGLTEAGCNALINTINSTLIKLGQKSLPKNKFLITK